jgi:hypothetical protein
MTAGHMQWSCLLHIELLMVLIAAYCTANSYAPGTVHCNGHDWCSTIAITVHALLLSHVYITLLTALVGVHVALKIIVRHGACLLGGTPTYYTTTCHG